MEGSGLAEYSVSQMLLAEGEDLYNLMGPKTPTYRGWWNDPGVEAYKRCWSEQLPAHIKKIATLLGEKPSFTPPGNTVGEIYLLAMLHQVISCRKSALNCVLLCPVCSHPARAAMQWFQKRSVLMPAECYAHNLATKLACVFALV